MHLLFRLVDSQLGTCHSSWLFCSWGSWGLDRSTTRTRALALLESHRPTGRSTHCHRYRFHFLSGKTSQNRTAGRHPWHRCTQLVDSSLCLQSFHTSCSLLWWLPCLTPRWSTSPNLHPQSTVLNHKLNSCQRKWALPQDPHPLEF